MMARSRIDAIKRQQDNEKGLVASLTEGLDDSAANPDIIEQLLAEAEANLRNLGLTFGTRISLEQTITKYRALGQGDNGT